ncbi:MAG: hypothetical protein HYV32_01505 [Candidatus Kerfeldbacteria bacterium]|nr:hypothetical protein [Candidatus Kerfeldbacteria bacterium]
MLKKTFIFTLIVSTFIWLSSSTPVMATSVYGALYKAAHLTPNTGSNTESVVTYFPNQPGFIAMTTNDVGAEWWISGPLGLKWKQVQSNPLSSYGCTQVGRHSVQLYNDDMYIGGTCDQGGQIFILTGKKSVSLIHTHSTGDNAGYPTSAVLNDKLYMFFQGGYTECDATGTCTDVTNAQNQPTGAPLEASKERNGAIALSFTSGEVTFFDGSSYTVIGEQYLENMNADDETNPNLPSIEWFNNELFVGNQDMQNGASLFQYDGSNTEWNNIYDFGKQNKILNKMQLSREIDGTNYLIMYTANGDEGTNIKAMDPQFNVFDLVDPSLGSTSLINAEVVSVINRTIQGAHKQFTVQLFGTKADPSNIYVLLLENGLAFSPDTTDIENDIIEENDELGSSLESTTASSADAMINAGEKFELRIPKNNVQIGDAFILYVDGEKVDQTIVETKEAIVLTYAAAQEKLDGDTFTIQVGRRVAYGVGKNKIRSRNIIGGAEMTIGVAE